MEKEMTLHEIEAEWMEEGRQEGKQEVILSLLRDGAISVDCASAKLGIPKEELLSLLNAEQA